MSSIYHQDIIRSRLRRQNVEFVVNCCRRKFRNYATMCWLIESSIPVPLSTLVSRSISYVLIWMFNSPTFTLLWHSHWLLSIAYDLVQFIFLIYLCIVWVQATCILRMRVAATSCPTTKCTNALYSIHISIFAPAEATPESAFNHHEVAARTATVSICLCCQSVAIPT